ncbi:MAG: NTP transferase domain-containing protein [Bacteroidales bacterium]
MHYAIIAAGEGSRLKQEGVVLPKPLVQVNGEALIERLIRIFLANNAESISLIINEEMTEVQAWVSQLKLKIPFNLVIKSTPGSMHSFAALASFLEKGKCCLTTVDTIFYEKEFSAYIQAFEQNETLDGMMAVTDYIDDEKPLYVDVDAQMKITGFLDKEYDSAKYISGGIYGLTPRSLGVLDDCFANGKLRMREFQRGLVEAGLTLQAFPFSKIIDVDHAGDIAKAEKITSPNTTYDLRLTTRKTIAAIRRSPEFSPNSVENDAAIFEAVVAKLRNLGYVVNEYEENRFIHKYEDEKVVLHMARRWKTLAKLMNLEEKGVKVFNSANAVVECDRFNMTIALLTAQIPYPETVILMSDEKDVLQKVPFEKMWVKRADGHTTSKEDVCFVDNISELPTVLLQFANRGIKKVVVNRHLEGNLVKFYGVSDTDFFHWFYPLEVNHSKFGQEIVNGHNPQLKFDQNRLETICREASLALGLQIWGGDAIVSADGQIHVIDFNDFPSFRPFREEAAEAMVEIIRSVL